MLTFQKTMVWKSDGGQNSMEACDESSSSEVYRNPSQVQQAESKEIHLPKGSLFLHSGLPLRSHLLLQRGVPSRSPAATKLQLYEVEIRRGVVGKDRKHEDFCRGTKSVPGEVTDGWRADEKVCGGRGGDDAAEEEEPDGVRQEEECHEKEKDWAESSQ